MSELNFFKHHLGKRIAFLRERRGLTQTQLASLINKDFQSISRIENGRTGISAFALKQLADVLEVSLNDMVDFTDIKNNTQ
jgi:transcriptional regulator with XRE-family HTH domain